MKYDGMEEAARQASLLLKAMSNERRLVILCHLSRGERSVTELCDLVGVSQSALSQHLAKLRHDDLVETRREAQTIYYSLKGRGVPKILDALYHLYCADTDTPQTTRAQ
ncbi:ArsR/SmtB family transcription factor [Ferruginivarius sediminum]|uniref:ArsR family transcriptional regulator n=1 Tax=Ferruginivarius sediminum TaxID=2661937 RepID=A0A369T941_9PROT|nr:metalloregulator ArsR/SmtB family transcription factor [Ferruginivarius sediminum]RDD60687.1 ArsR family transcriptional regulator [Ferruginivarius sediminum]